MPQSAQELFQQGIASAQAGDLAGAEALLRQCIALDPKNAVAMLNLGVVLLNRGNNIAAEQMLFQSVNTQATVESISMLARVLEINGKPAEAEHCYGVILNAVPNHPPTLAKLAELADAEGNRKKAREWYGKLWKADPANFSAGTAYAINSFNDDPAETNRAFQLLMEQTKNDEAAQAKVLMTLLPYREFHERIKHGLMPYHGTAIDELFFTFARGEFERFRELSLRAAANAPADATAALRKFTALFCARDRLAAEREMKVFAHVAEGQIYENLVFDPSFYQMLETMDDEALSRNLPPVSEIRTAWFSEEPIVYLACNYLYFENFAMPMIRSLADRSPDAQLHVHIMDASEDEMKKLASFCDGIALKIAVTVEQPCISKESSKAARAYYHAIRFIRFYQHLKQYDHTLWLMDVDALFNREPRALFETMGENDAAFRIRPGRVEPWNQFNACIVGATPKPASLRYFKLIAAYIAHFHQRKMLRWGIDQLAMYGVHEFLRDEKAAPALSLLGDRAIDYDYFDDGIVWCNSGRNKFLHLEKRKPGLSLADLDPDRAKYLTLFEKYYAPA